MEMKEVKVELEGRKRGKERGREILYGGEVLSALKQGEERPFLHGSPNGHGSKKPLWEAQQVLTDWSSRPLLPLSWGESQPVTGGVRGLEC